MRGLTIVVTEGARLRAALELAAAQAALGGRARVFCQGPAVAALRLDADEPAHTAAGLPDLRALAGDALALGVEILACQSGLALCGMSADTLDERFGFTGLLQLLATLGEDRLLLA